MSKQNEIDIIKQKINDIYDEHGVNGFFGVIKTIDMMQVGNEMVTQSVSGMGIVLDNNTGVIIVDGKDKLQLEFLSDSQDDMKQGVSLFVDNIHNTKNMLVKISNFVDKLIKSFEDIDYRQRDGANDTSLN